MGAQAGEGGEGMVMEIHEAEAASSNVVVLAGQFLAQKLGVPPQAVSSTAACGPRSPAARTLAQRRCSPCAASALFDCALHRAHEPALSEHA